MILSSLRLSVLIVSVVSIRFTAATLSLPSLQPISGFSNQCTQAYQSPINACPDASSFIKPSSSPCTKDCVIALVNAGASIQQACQLQTANRGTVIGQAFIGNLAQWLCSGGNSGDGNAATTSTASNVTPATASTSNSATSSSSSSVSSSVSTKTSTAASSSSISRSTISTSTSTSNSSSSSASSTAPNVSSSVSHSTSSITTSKSAVTTHSSSKSTSSTSTTKASHTTFDSTPFDQTVNAASNLGVRSNTETWNRIISYSVMTLGLILFVT